MRSARQTTAVWGAALALAGVVGCASVRELPAQDESTRRIEVEVLRRTNVYRRSHSLPALREASELTRLARGHSGDLARRRASHVDHAGLEDRFERAREFLALSAFAENVARMGRSRAEPAKWVVDGWAASPVHRRNLEGNYDLVGVGVIQRTDGNIFFTQIFGRTAKPNAGARSARAD